jgi:ribosomal protein S18 acetylase RimI-like enzyme
VVEEVASATPAVAEALESLIPQLSTSAPPLTLDQLAAIVESPATILFVARNDQAQVLGSLTLVVFRAPTGPRAWIEDVVVDERQRGAGIGSLLVEAALKRAQSEGARTVDLTSRPTRVEANRLYVRAGFTLRETNVYRYSFE